MLTSAAGKVLFLLLSGGFSLRKGDACAMNKRQKRFCDEYLADKNRSAKQAALNAGYSPKTAEYASRWINDGGLKKPNEKFNPEMRAYIDEQLERIHSEKTADAKEVMEYLTSVLRGESRAATVVVEGTGDGYSEARLINKPPDERERLKAAELIGKAYGAFNDSLNINAVIPVVLDGGDQLED